MAVKISKVPEHLESFLFGLMFGMGFSIAAAVLHFVAGIISGAPK
jgi:RsiW-degrading membrane proteinase PrsW (M82 family)